MDILTGSDDDLINDIDIGLEFQRDSHHMHSIPRRRYSAETIVTYCLQALLSHSTIESHCRKMIDFSCLPIFQKIVNEFPNSPIIKSIIGKIIANMSLFSETHFSIWQSGWVGLLAQWKQSPNLLVRIVCLALDHFYILTSLCIFRSPCLPQKLFAI